MAYSRTQDMACPDESCGHKMAYHSNNLGCQVGWNEDYDEGCDCPMTLAGQHNPPSEAEADKNIERDGAIL